MTDLPDHMKFGYKHMVETRTIRERLIAEGHDPNDPMLVFAVSKAYTEAHKDDLTLRQRQDYARWAGEPWVAPYAVPTTVLRLLPEEIEYLRDRLAGVNDPIGHGILLRLEGLNDGTA